MNQEKFKEFLLTYEVPSFAEYVSISWIQGIIARFLAWKVNRKLDRYERRKKQEEWLTSFNPRE